MMRRRTFLKLAGLGATTIAAGSMAFRVGVVWWEQEAAAELKVLSPQEARIVAAIADAMFPGDDAGLPNAVDVGVVEACDDYLRSLNEQDANFLRLLIHAIDEMAIVSDLGLTRFHKRSREERIAILEAWDDSSLSTRRMAFRGLKFILATNYCERPEVLAAAGITFSCGGAA